MFIDIRNAVPNKIRNSITIKIESKINLINLKFTSPYKSFLNFYLVFDFYLI